MVSYTIHETHKYRSQQKTLKLDLTQHYSYLKIILLQYFQFSIFYNKQYPNRPLVSPILVHIARVLENWSFMQL